MKKEKSSTERPLDSYNNQRLEFLSQKVDAFLATIWEDYIEALPKEAEQSTVSVEVFHMTVSFLIKRLAILFTLVEFHADREFLANEFKEEEEIEQ